MEDLNKPLEINPIIDIESNCCNNGRSQVYKKNTIFIFFMIINLIYLGCFAFIILKIIKA